MGATYAKERLQFGRPIAMFQAVKHHCANMCVATEMATVSRVERVALYLCGRRRSSATMASPSHSSYRSAVQPCWSTSQSTREGPSTVRLIYWPV